MNINKLLLKSLSKDNYLTEAKKFFKINQF